MPVLKVQTNAPVTDEHTFMKEATALLSKELGKPERFIMVMVEKTPAMMFGGSSEPLLYAELKSISLPEEETAPLSAALCAFFAERLKVPQERMYIEFSNARRNMFGWNGKTF